MINSILKHINQSPNRFRELYVPLFKLNCNNEPYHAGTAFAVNFKGHSFLVTAAHVLDQDKDNTCDSNNQIFAMEKGTLVQINGFDLTDFRNYKSILGVELDLALLVPNGIAINDIIHRPFYNDDFYDAKLKQNLYSAACGFPSSKNKVIKRSRILTNRPYGYFGKLASSSSLNRAGFDSSLHFGIEILLKKTFHSGLREVKAPKPHGISGGPVFVVHDFMKPRLKLAPKLRGVVIEYSKVQKIIVCVDLFNALILACKKGLIKFN